MRSLAVVLVVGLLTGCTKRNPEYCDAAEPCSDGRVCDLTKNKCVDEDDGGPPPACFDAGNCPSATPICNEGICIQCLVSNDCGDPMEPVCELPPGNCRGCQAEPECAGRVDTPHCATDGRCVECLDSGDCDMATPVCDLPAGACRTCAADSECAELCDDGTGQCVPEVDIIYVDGSVGASGPACTKAAPCRTIGEGVAQVTGSRRSIKVAPGTYAEGVTLNNLDVRIVGPGASINPPGTNQACVIVQGTSTVRMEGLSLLGALGGTNADGLRCEGSAGSTTVILRELTIESNVGQGVDAANCTVTVERTRVASNFDGGVVLTNSDFTIRNSFIVANGRTTGGGSAFGGVQMGGPPSGPAGGVFEFNTVADNAANAVVAAGVICPVATAIAANDNIVFGNGGALQVSGMCSWTHSDIGQTPTPGGTGNINMDPQFVNIAAGDYHISGGSPCVNMGDPASTVTVDFDGDTRPSSGGFDIGADEVP